MGRLFSFCFERHKRHWPTGFSRAYLAARSQAIFLLQVTGSQWEFEMTIDASAGYDAIADEFIAIRSTSGRNIVRGWAKSLPSGCSVIDIGAGHGEPLTSALIDEGLSVWAIDASPNLVKAFRKRFPKIKVACDAVEHSTFFDRTFDAALMVGLIFLLDEDRQKAVIDRVADILAPDGRFLFSAPWQIGCWNDLLTNETSSSLGAEEYQRMLEQSGFALIATHEDESGTNYFESKRL